MAKTEFATATEIVRIREQAKARLGQYFAQAIDHLLFDQLMGGPREEFRLPDGRGIRCWGRRDPITVNETLPLQLSLLGINWRWEGK
jgi:hypothetical protein